MLTLDLIGSQPGIDFLEFGVACQRCGGSISRDGGGYVATWNVLQYVFVLLYVLYLCIDPLSLVHPILFPCFFVRRPTAYPDRHAESNHHFASHVNLRHITSFGHAMFFRSTNCSTAR